MACTDTPYTNAHHNSHIDLIRMKNDMSFSGVPVTELGPAFQSPSEGQVEVFFAQRGMWPQSASPQCQESVQSPFYTQQQAAPLWAGTSTSPEDPRGVMVTVLHPSLYTASCCLAFFFVRKLCVCLSVRPSVSLCWLVGSYFL